MEFRTLDLATPGGSKRELTEQGYLLIRDCKLARAGVFDYLAANFQPRAFNDRAPTDIIRVFRSEDTIIEAAKGFSGAPVTDTHPPEMLDLSNTKLFQKGHVNGEVKVVDGAMIADIIVTDQHTIQGIQAGKDQLSNGYFSQYVFDVGATPEGEAFDCEQVSFRANHVAVVAKGRNGAECRVSDAAELKPQEVKPMGTVNINGVSYEASEQVVQAVGNLQKTCDAAEAKIAEFGNVDTRIEEAVTANSSKLQATIDTQKAEIDTLKKDIPTADALDALAADRAALLAKAKLLAPTLDCAGKSNAEVRAAVVLAACPDLKTLDDQNEHYISARFDAEAARLKTKDGKVLDKALGDALKNEDGVADPVLAARDAAIERNKNAWKGKGA